MTTEPDNKNVDDDPDDFGSHCTECSKAIAWGSRCYDCGQKAQGLESFAEQQARVDYEAVAQKHTIAAALDEEELRVVTRAITRAQHLPQSRDSRAKLESALAKLQKG